jgi:hypothetical protein
VKVAEGSSVGHGDPPRVENRDSLLEAVLAATPSPTSYTGRQRSIGGSTRERELLASEERFPTLVEESPVAIVAETGGKSVARPHVKTDLLLTDVVLPGGLQGDEVVRVVSADRPALLVSRVKGLLDER